MIQVKIFYAKNDLRNFSYLILDKETGDSWVIDPFDEKPIIDYIRKEAVTLRGIFNTHQHWDHIRGNAGLQNQFKCSVLATKQAQIDLNDGHCIKFLETPGHTPDHLAFVWEKQNLPQGLFSGDTLFNSGVGNCQGGGNLDDLFETTNRLKQLDDHIVLYPGHDYVLRNLMFAKSCEPENKNIDEALKIVREADTEQGLLWTLEQEKKVNPFFRLDSEEVRQKFVDEQMVLDSEDMKERKLFKKLRSLRDKW